MSGVPAPGRRSRAASASIILLAVSAFAFDPFGFDRWVFAKEFVLVLAAIIGWSAVPLGTTPRWSRWWFCAALAVLFLGAISASAPMAQLFGRWPRYEGLVTLGAYALAFAAGARVLGGSVADDETARRGRLFLRVFALAMSVTAVIAFCETLGLRPIASDLLRPGSLLGNASDLGIVGVIGIALFLPPVLESVASLSPRAAGLGAVGLFASLATVLLSASRGALIGAALAVALVAVLAWRQRERRRRWWSGLGVTTVVGIALALALPFTSGRILGTVVDSAASASNRLELWMTSGSVIAEHPLVGTGPSGFADAVTARLSESWFETTGLGGWIESPHNILLQIGVAGGIPGLLLTATGAVLAAVQVRRHRWRGPFGASAIIAGLGAAGALVFHFTSPGTMILLCLLLGGSLARPTTSRPDPTPVRVVAVSLLIGWLLVLCLAVASDHRMKAGMQALAEGDVSSAQNDFAAAKQLRLWDADLPLIVSESLASTIETRGFADVVPFASTWSTEAVERIPSSTRALKAAAVIAQYQGDFAAGIDLMERATILSPTDPQVFHRLGALQFLAGYQNSALISLERAETLAPDDDDIRATLEYVRATAGMP